MTTFLEATIAVDGDGIDSIELTASLDAKGVITMPIVFSDCVKPFSGDTLHKDIHLATPFDPLCFDDSKQKRLKEKKRQ